jgi:hypothetical protein
MINELLQSFEWRHLEILLLKKWKAWFSADHKKTIQFLTKISKSYPKEKTENFIKKALECSTSCYKFPSASVIEPRNSGTQYGETRHKITKGIFIIFFCFVCDEKFQKKYKEEDSKMVWWVGSMFFLSPALPEVVKV